MNLFSDIIIVCWKVSHTKWVKLLSMSPDGQLLLWLSLCQPSHVWVSRSGTIWSFTRPTGLQQNTGAADVYGLRFSPRPVLIGAPSYPCRENLSICCTSSASDLSLSVSNRLPYTQYFGGVSSLSKEQYLKINGFPNNYWGWGGEDDDIFNRSDNF